MTRLAALLLCLALGWALRPGAPPRVVTLPDPPRNVPIEGDPTLQPFLAEMTADDLVRGLWAMGAPPTLRPQLLAMVETRKKVEALRAARREARTAWLMDAAPLAGRCP